MERSFIALVYLHFLIVVGPALAILAVSEWREWQARKRPPTETPSITEGGEVLPIRRAA